MTSTDLPRSSKLSRYHSTAVDCLSAQDAVPDDGDVHGDRLLRVLPVWLDAGVFHSSLGLLDLLRRPGQRTGHWRLLLQPVEGLRLRRHRGC